MTRQLMTLAWMMGTIFFVVMFMFAFIIIHPLSSIIATTMSGTALTLAGLYMLRPAYE